MNKRPFKCKRCKYQVAETDGEQIFFGPKPVPMNPLRLLFTCPNCLCRIDWVRCEKQIDAKAQNKVRLA